MMLKKRLAREIVTQLYSQKAASEAEERFTKVFQKRKVPEEIKEYHVTLDAGIDLRDILVVTKLAKSRSEANRLIKQGAVSIDGEKVNSLIAPIKSGSIIKVGKRRFAKVINTDTLSP
jgi:tyrosyl-tRNA synthetase